MSVRWLIDKSALARTGTPQVARVLTPQIDGGLIAVSVVTELEISFSARSTGDHDDSLGLLDRLVRVVLPVRAEQVAHYAPNTLVLVEGPEIAIKPVGTRHVSAGEAG